MLNEPEIRVKDVSGLEKAAAGILGIAGENRVFAFYGEMGAGKTTLIKAICRVLNVSDNTSSPTFSIINEYRTLSGKPVYHFDFYRVRSEAEAQDTGCLEYFHSGNYCFIEWPEKIPSLLPEDSVKITINVENGDRLIRVAR